MERTDLYLKNSPADSLITFCSAAPSFGAALHSCFLDFTFSVLIYAFSLVVLRQMVFCTYR